MNFSWQDITALVLVVLAAVYLMRRVSRALTAKKQGSCSSCDSCGPPAGANVKPLVTIDSPTDEPKE